MTCSILIEVKPVFTKSPSKSSTFVKTFLTFDIFTMSFNWFAICIRSTFNSQNEIASKSSFKFNRFTKTSLLALIRLAVLIFSSKSKISSLSFVNKMPYKSLSMMMIFSSFWCFYSIIWLKSRDLGYELHWYSWQGDSLQA